MEDRDRLAPWKKHGSYRDTEDDLAGGGLAAILGCSHAGSQGSLTAGSEGAAGGSGVGSHREAPASLGRRTLVTTPGKPGGQDGQEPALHSTGPTQPVRKESWRLKFERGKTIRLHRGKRALEEAADESGFAQSEKRFLIFHPRTSRRMLWDMLILVILIYSCMIVPYDIAFFPAEVQCDGVWYITDSIIDILFMMDIALNFRTAVITSETRWLGLKNKTTGTADGLKLASKSNIETNAWEIAKYYADPRELFQGNGGGFFILDLLGSIPFDWFLCASSVAGEDSEVESFDVVTTARIPKFVKILSAMRMFKFLRLSRLGKMIRRLRDRMQINPGLLHLLQFLLFLVLCTHWFACFFYFLSTLMDDDESVKNLPGHQPTCWGEQFIVANDLGQLVRPYCHKIDGVQTDPDCLEMTPGFQYLTSMYWATTSLTTVGLGDITAITVYEMAFSIVVLLTGGFIFSYMVVNVSRMLDKINIHATQKRDRMYELESFLHRERLPPNLKRRVRENFRRTLESQRRMPDYVKEFSGSLRKEIYLQLFKETVLRVPAFNGFSDSVLAYIIENFKFNNKPAGETLFREGEMGNWMYFLHEGSVELTFGGPSVGAAAPFKVKVVAGGFFGENAILGQAARNATAVTTSWCLLCALTTTDVEDAMQKYPQAGMSFQQFKARMQLHAARNGNESGKLSPTTKAIMTPYAVLKGIKRFRGQFTPTNATKAVGKGSKGSADSSLDGGSARSLPVPKGEPLGSPSLGRRPNETCDPASRNTDSTDEMEGLSPDLKGGNRARRKRRASLSEPERDPEGVVDLTKELSERRLLRDPVLPEPAGASEAPGPDSRRSTSLRSTFDDMSESVQGPSWLDYESPLAVTAPVTLQEANKAITLLAVDIAALQEYAKGLRLMNTHYQQLCIEQSKKIKGLQGKGAGPETETLPTSLLSPHEEDSKSRPVAPARSAETSPAPSSDSPGPETVEDNGSESAKVQWRSRRATSIDDTFRES